MQGIPASFMGILFVVFFVLWHHLFKRNKKILKEYERGVVFRLGRVIPVKGPGLVIIIPVIDKLVR